MKATLTPVTRRISAALFLCLLGACAADLDDKRGQDGEECLADQDCRADLICEARTCQPLGGASNNGNNGVSNNGNNGVSNNGVSNNENNGNNDTIPALCEDVCEKIEGCFSGEIGEGLAECTQECAEDLGDRPDEAALASLRCLLGLSCDDLLSGEGERCVSGGDFEEREAMCEEFAYGPLINCAEDGTLNPDEFYEVCLGLASSLGEQGFAALSDCYQFSSCRGLTECAADWAGLMPPAPTPNPGAPYIYLLIEDQSDSDDSSWAGVDIDAVALFKASGEAFYVSTLEDFQIFDSRASDPAAIFGPPDTSCALGDGRSVSLGGPGAYLLVSFLLNRADAHIEEGDQIQVYEIGQSYCGVEQDERVTLYAGKDLNELVYLGDVGGTELLTVQRLP
jgi:hypothetical protein